LSKILIGCPHCKCLMQSYELMSYIVHEASWFSDGKSDSLSFHGPEQRIGICSACEHPFWKQDAISKLDPYDEKYADLPDLKDLFDLPSMRSTNFPLEKIRFFQELIKEGFSNTNERTIYLRQQLWWAINDLIRHRLRYGQLLKLHSFLQLKNMLKSRRESLKNFKRFKPLFQENLVKLSKLLPAERDEDLLLLAEVYREQGLFKKAQFTLDKVSDNSGKAFKQIKQAVVFRRRRVFCIC